MEYTKEQVKQLILEYNELSSIVGVIKEIILDDGIDKGIEVLNKRVDSLHEVVSKFAEPFQELENIA